MADRRTIAGVIHRNHTAAATITDTATSVNAVHSLDFN
jgi:hypothetical protein